METKGIFRLLEAFRRIGERFDDVKLSVAGAFIGDGEMTEWEVRERFLRELETLGRSLPGRVAYLGVIGGEEKVRRLMDSDIFVLPTFYRSEAFPLSIIEAMRSGNAIVTTRHNYLPEIVSGRNGVLIEPRSSGAVEDALNGLLANGGKTREIQEHNIEEAKSRYSCERYLERISAVLGVTPAGVPPAEGGGPD
jgi:glycosyltransferase involved in cell wall biosynthesis